MHEPMTADAIHFLAIDPSWGEPRLKLVCTATKGAFCHKRHPSPEVESFSEDNPDLIDTDDCWAVEWVSEAGWESVTCDEMDVFPCIPVRVTYEEGPVMSPMPSERSRSRGPAVSRLLCWFLGHRWSWVGLSFAEWRECQRCGEIER